jgi:hypothetical protein
VHLTDEQKRTFVREGYLVVPGVVPAPMRNRARRLIDTALDESTDRVANYVFNGHEHCDPLQHAPEILALLTETPALALAEELSEPGGFWPTRCCMVATRLPDRGPRPPWPPTGHLDGIPNRANGLPPWELFPFAVLVGVFLSELTERDRGNFVVYPRSHHTVAAHVREHPDGWFDSDGYGPPPMGVPEFPLGDPVEILARPGDVVLAHYELVHSVGYNASPDIRYAIYYRLVHRAITSDWGQLADLWRGFPNLRGQITPRARG